MGLTFNLADLTEAAVDRVPDRVALITAERTLTYAQLEERANRLAAWLAAQGVGPGDHVGCYLFNGTEYVETMLRRVQAAGGADQRQLPLRRGRAPVPLP